MLLIICTIAVGALVMAIKVMQKNPYIGIRITCTLLFILSMTRYTTLIVFERATSLEILIKMQNFYFITIIGITIPTLLLLWYITPYYREKIKPIFLAIFCMPWLVFYTLLVALKPYKIVKATSRGYGLNLRGDWPIYASILQTTFICILIVGSLYGWKLYKHQQTRSQYMILIMCQLLFLIDGLTCLGLAIPSIPVFTLTEVFGFLGIYYGFSKATIDARGIKR